MIKIPYTFKIVFPVMGWGLLCSFFSYTLILTVAKIEQEVLVYGAPLFLVFLLILFLLRYGFGFFYKEAKIINSNISYKDNLEKKESKEDIRITLKSLVSFCKNFYSFSFASGLLFVAITVLSVSFNYGTLEDFLIVLISSLVGLFFFVSFSLFFSQQIVFPVIKKCREVLFKESDESIVLSSVKSKFYLLFLFPFLSVLVVMISIYPVDYKTIILALTGVVMALIIGRVIYSYIYRSFSEIEKFGRKDETNFIVGSLDKEFVDVAFNFSNLFKEMDLLRKQSEKTKKEMEKRMEELEKFFDLTVDRENEMVELKKQISELKKCIKK